MKLTNSDGTITDTDKMPDVDAMIAEKMAELKEICVKAKRQILIIADVTNDPSHHYSMAWSVKAKDLKCEVNEDMTATDRQEYTTGVLRLVFNIDQYVRFISQQKLHVAMAPEQPEEPDSFNAS